MELEETIQSYKELKKHKELIKNIDTNFFFEFAETVLQELEKLQKHCKEMMKEKQELTSALLDSVPKKKVEELVSHLKLLKRHMALNDEERAIFDVCIKDTQKLLEDK